MWPSLMASRTKRQAPRLLWRGRGVGGSTAINGQIAIRGVLERLRPVGRARLRGLVRPARPALLQPARGRPRLRRPALSTAAAGRSRSIARPWSNGARSTWRCATRRSTSAIPGPRTSTRPTPTACAATPSTAATACASPPTTAISSPRAAAPNLEIRGDSLVDRVLLDGRRAIGVRAPPRRRVAGPPRPAGRAGGRCLPLAADPAALGHRPGRASEVPRHRGGRGSAGRRRRLRPSLCPHRAQAEAGAPAHRHPRPPHQLLRQVQLRPRRRRRTPTC